MILIKSTEYDYSTFEVAKWLKHFKHEYIQLNCDFSEVNEILLSNNNSHLQLADTKIAFSKVNSFWYRRKSHLMLPTLNESLIHNKAEVKKNIGTELMYLNEYAYYNLFKYIGTRHINHPNFGDLNRLKTLDIAANIGLLVPNYIVTNKKEYVRKFQNKYKKIVIKPISNAEFLKTKKINYLQYTKLISINQINKLPELFFPSLFQEYIEKDFEIRTFYINGSYKSMAIFSQESKQTSIDFRRYNTKDPNIKVPFKLPKLIENKITKVFKAYKMNSGSIDLLHTPSNKYFFLEINPVGQFGMVSEPCNYYLEKIIAKKLIQYETKTRKNK